MTWLLVHVLGLGQWLVWLLLAAGVAAAVYGYLQPAPVRWLLQAAGALLLMAAAFMPGCAYMDQREDLARLKAQNTALQFDLDTADQLADLAFKQGQQQDARAADLSDKVADYERELAQRPNAACTLDDDDVRRLRELAR